jgi:argininosuccinate lyase
VAERLGFDGVQRHVTAVQLSRGKIEAAVVHALVQCTATANRLASDLVLFATSEFGFVTMREEYTTGSSIMPQKRNPDVAELIRATHHRVLAELQLLLALPAGLPGGYHRDLQLTKESVMRATLSAASALDALAHLLPGVSWQPERMRVSLSPDLFATADALSRVAHGVPFRDAYREAAAGIDGLEAPAAADVLGSYVTPGTPGRVCADDLRAALRRRESTERPE